MNNYSAPGDILSVTATGDHVSGDVVQYGQVVGIAANSALTGETLSIQRTGIIRQVIKEAGTAYAIGDIVHFNGTAFSAAAATTGDLIVGYAASVQGTGDVLGDVLLDGTARADEA